MREELNKILAKGSLEDTDVNTLAKFQHLLSQEEKVRLGFVPAPVKAEVVKQVEVAPEAPAPVPEKKVKKVSKKK